MPKKAETEKTTEPESMEPTAEDLAAAVLRDKCAANAPEILELLLELRFVVRDGGAAPKLRSLLAKLEG